MIVVVVITVALGALLLWALYAEQVAAPPRRTAGPDWVGLPTPAQVGRTDFPLAVAGYDQRAVDAHVRAVARAYAHLYAVVAEADGAVPSDGMRPGSRPSADGPGDLPPPVDTSWVTRPPRVERSGPERDGDADPAGPAGDA